MSKCQPAIWSKGQTLVTTALRQTCIYADRVSVCFESYADPANCKLVSVHTHPVQKPLNVAAGERELCAVVATLYIHCVEHTP
jgi:hypothetical protein